MIDQSLFWQDGSKASYVACPAGKQLTIASQRATLYYKKTSDVSTEHHDGTIAPGASASFTVGQYVIAPLGVQAMVIAKVTEGAPARRAA